ncbi:hypothetical protein L2E82_07802 [Cichorium intybus]|uniref:Uncharacterized protein n=1 Tax=Cichorium intybus TaxID=13427 RepID=A0ACB9G5U8_CICIN|nr:hypothetical protein L2E82_07802 [Cichorium intybus]
MISKSPEEYKGMFDTKDAITYVLFSPLRPYYQKQLMSMVLNGQNTIPSVKETVEFSKSIKDDLILIILSKFHEAGKGDLNGEDTFKEFGILQEFGIFDSVIQKAQKMA